MTDTKPDCPYCHLQRQSSQTYCSCCGKRLAAERRCNVQTTFLYGDGCASTITFRTSALEWELLKETDEWKAFEAIAFEKPDQREESKIEMSEEIRQLRSDVAVMAEKCDDASSRLFDIKKRIRNISYIAYAGIAGCGVALLARLAYFLVTRQ